MIIWVLKEADDVNARHLKRHERDRYLCAGVISAAADGGSPALKLARFEQADAHLESIDQLRVAIADRVEALRGAADDSGRGEGEGQMVAREMLRD